MKACTWVSAGSEFSPFPPSLFLCSFSLGLLLSFSVFRMLLQLENSMRRKEMLQENAAVAPPYVSCHDFLARVAGFPRYSERDALKTQHNPFCCKEWLFAWRFCFTLSSFFVHLEFITDCTMPLLRNIWMFLESFKARICPLRHLDCWSLSKYCSFALRSLTVFELPVLGSLERHRNGWCSLGTSAPFCVRFAGWACNSCRVDSVDLAYLGKGQDCWSMCHLSISFVVKTWFRNEQWTSRTVSRRRAV